MRLPLFLKTPGSLDVMKNVGKEQALLDDYKKQKKASDTMAGQYAESLRKLGQVQQQAIPLQTPNDTQTGLMVLGDLLRNLTSTVPESQRQNIPSSLMTFRGIKEEDRQRLQEAERMRVENERNALLANAQAEEARYKAAQDALLGSERALERQGQESRFQRGLTQDAMQFNRTQGLAESNARFNQFIQAEGLNLNKAQFAEVQRHNAEMERLAGESEAAKQARNYADLMKTGLFTSQEATNMTYGAQLKIAQEYKDMVEMSKIVTPTMRGQRILQEWAQADQAFKAEMAQRRAATAASNRANRPNPTLALDPGVKRDVDDWGKAITSNRASIQDTTNRVNGILANKENYGEDGKLDAKSIAAINKLKDQSKALQAINNKLRGNIESRLGGTGVSVDDVLNELEKAFGTED